METEDLKLILQKVSNDCERSFRTLFDLYYARIFRVAFYHVKSEEIAQEVVMDVFEKLWKYRKKLQEIDHFTNYIYTAVRNQSLNYLKKNKLSTDPIDEHYNSTGLIEYLEPEKIFLGRELARSIEEIVSALPPRCQLIYRMVREEGLKYKDVADTLDISLKAVENQLLIALKRIRQALLTTYQHSTEQKTDSRKDIK